MHAAQNDPLTKALADSDRSYLSAKASVSQLAGEMLAEGGPRSPLVQRSDFSRASEQLQHFRGWVYASIRPIAQKIAGQPLRVGRVRAARSVGNKQPGQPAQNVEQLDSHPILDMLADPNELMVAWSLMFSAVASMELTGRQLWWLPTIKGRRRVFPIPTSWIVGFEGATKLDRFLIRPPRHVGEPIPLASDEVCYFAYPHPGDPHGACSPLQAAGLAVEADEAIQHSQRAMFGQGINPRHALIVGRTRGADGSLTDRRPRLNGSQRRQLIDSIRAIYSGVHAHGEPLILDNLIEDVKRISSTSAEMDWLQSGTITKDRITQAFGVNPIIMGQIENANRASALAAEEHFAEFTVNPKIELLSQSLTEWLAPVFASEGERLKVWIEKVIPSDVEMDARRMTLLAQQGALTLNELRQWAGLRELDGFDIPAGQSDSLAEAVGRMVDERMPSINGQRNGHARPLPARG